MRSLLGIDLGTSGLKAAVFDLDGTLLGLGRAPNRTLPGPQGWAEQDPRDWWAGCCRAVREALDQAGRGAADLAAAGVCGFHHCPVFLDSEGEPVRPTIVTHDGRLGASLAELRRDGLLADVALLSGSPVTTGHLPTIVQAVRTHDPLAIDRTRWVLLAKDYLRYRLTGRIGTELCDATGTHLVAMPAQDWSEELCSLVGLPRSTLPAIGRSYQIAGHITSEASRATGLRAGTPVVYGGGDSHCALLGLGVTSSGETGLLLGTNSTLRVSFAGLVRPADQMVWIQQHVVPGHFTASASTMAGSSALAWFRETWWGGQAEGPASYETLESMAAGVPAGSDGLLFHPYLFGERSPFFNPEARAAFVGLRHWHGAGHLSRSIMEGVAFSVGNCLDALRAIARDRGEAIHRIRTGQSGGSRLALWREILTDALDQAIEVVDAQEPGCLGAAMLAGLGAGVYANVEQAVERSVRVLARTTVHPPTAVLYRERRDAFNDVYRAIESRLYR